MSAHIYELSAFRSARELRNFSRQTHDISAGMQGVSSSLNAIYEKLGATQTTVAAASTYLKDVGSQFDRRRALHARCLRAIDNGTIADLEEMAFLLTARFKCKGSC